MNVLLINGYEIFDAFKSQESVATQIEEFKQH